MSKKFEQLLDLVVNEDIEKANNLFHEIVVEMSKEIYENMISQEQNVDDMDEGYDESMHNDMDDDSMEEAMGGDASDQFVDDVTDDSMDDESMDDESMDDEYMDDESMDDESMDDEMGDDMDDGSLDDRVMDLESELDDIKSQIERILDMEQDEPEHADELGGMEDETDDMDDMVMTSEPSPDEKRMAMEERRMTREYREKVSKPSNNEEGSVNKHSPVSSAKGRPTSDATAGNLVQGGEEKGKSGMGVLKKGGEFVPSGTQNVGSTKTKGYSNKVSSPSNKADHEKSLLGK